jgi:hypothetical protein
MSIEIQQRLPIAIAFSTNKVTLKVNTRSKNEREYRVISKEQWASVVLMEPDLAFKTIESFRIKPVTLKVSIDPAVYKDLGYISEKLNLKLSEQSLIKEAVEVYVKENMWLIGKVSEDKVIGVGHGETRMIYVKIKLPGTIAEAIGYPNRDGVDGSGICEALGITRQYLVKTAVDRFINSIKS